MVEGFSRTLSQAKNSGYFNGINMGGTFKVTRLLFVDDIMDFCNGSTREDIKLKEPLIFSPLHKEWFTIIENHILL